MALEVIPQSIFLYPQDTKAISLRSSREPVIYNSIVAGAIESDHSISFTSGGGGTIFQKGTDGSVGYRIRFDSRMIPASGGSWSFVLASLFGTGPGIQVQVFPTSTIFRGNGVTIETISRTLVAGDKYELLATGPFFRLLINDVIESEYGSGAYVQYPLYGSVQWSTPFTVGNPHLSPIELYSGTWETADNADGSGAGEWTVTGGTGDDLTFVNDFIYTAGSTPGNYFITCTVGSSVYQYVSTQVAIPPLSIVGNRYVTLQPGEVTRFVTNYDNAQNDIVAWTSSGGTFDAADNFTAPTTPGSYTVDATQGFQLARIFLTIPPVITPNIIAAKPGEVIDFGSNVTSPVFSASAGSINSSSGVWTAPSTIGTECRITATGGGYTATLDVIVLESFAYQPNYTVPVRVSKKILVSEAEDGTRVSRVKSAGSRTRREFDLTFRDRNVSELQAVMTFHEQYYPGSIFIYEDSILDERIVVYFNSDLAYEVEATCGITYNFKLIERN